MARPHGLAHAVAAMGALAVGFAAAAWARSVAETLGSAPDAVVTFGAVSWLGLAVGASLGRGGDPGMRLLAVSALTFAAPWILPRVPAVLVWAGGAVDSSPLGLVFARVLAGALLLGPAAALAGSALRCAARALPEGEAARPVLAGALAAAAGGALAAVVLPLTASVTQPVAGTLLLLTGVAASSARKAKAEDTPQGRVAYSGIALTGGVVAFAVAALGFLGPRALVPAFGNELPGIPLASGVFLAGVTAGALLALALLRFALRFAASTTLAALLAGAVAWLAVSVPRVAPLPSRFAEAVEGVAHVDAVRSALVFALPVVLPGALFAGIACVSLAALLPEQRRSRSPWLARTLAGVAAGACIGLAMRLSLDPLGIAGAMVLAGVLIAAPAAWLLAARTPRSTARIAAGLLAVAAVALLAARAARFDRSGWLVERTLHSEASPVGVQKSWRILDEDAAAGTWAVLKRGHEKRLFVNGRFEMGSVSQIKSHGLLAHLPLLVRPGAKSVAVLGAGNGRAVRVALAHPIERLLVLAPAPAAVHAAEQFRSHGPAPFDDGRVRVVTGDVVDLLARCGPQDVILNQISGSWTELSSRASTREFLELVRRRLGEHGVYGQWVPGSSLTKPGFQTLLATFAAVFPHVEIWAGQEGDVVMLAKTTRSPHDGAGLARAYQDPGLAASLAESWIADPPTLLSQFLSPDEVVRGISRSSPIHSRRSPELASVEAARRRSEPTVDPVPGLAEIRGDVREAFAGLPGGTLHEAVARAVRARDLERQALAAELAPRGSLGRSQVVAHQCEDAVARKPRDGSLRR
ncbi:MAG: spermidine synthase, partial [Candidatus Eiseniibacteriota bacterium]